MVIDGILINQLTALTFQAFELLTGLQDLLKTMVEESNQTAMSEGKPSFERDITLSEVLEPDIYDVEADPCWWDMIYSKYDDEFDISLCLESQNWVGSAYSAAQR